MSSKRDEYFPGYVKVDVRSRLPKLWGWSIHIEIGNTRVAQSNALYRCAEDAWKAGQAAVAGFEMSDKIKRLMREAA